MAVNRFNTVNEVVNHVAVETGLTPVTDVFATDDPAFRQLTYLLTTCVQELMDMYPWQILTRGYQYTTGAAETGDLALPTDFAYMINQTGWERAENVPLLGPLSPQEWTYLLGRDLAGSTIYASFRFDQNQLRVYPNDPMPANLNLNFEYISRNLLSVAGTSPTEYTDEATSPGDTVLFPPTLIRAMLKMKFLEAKGFDSSAATNQFYMAFDSLTGKDNAAPVLSTARRGAYPLINTFRNTPDTGYGGV